jgi:DNA integrity scanning protein DisA with diadenylate cyclase activity
MGASEIMDNLKQIAQSEENLGVSCASGTSYVDFSFQFNAAKDHDKIEKRIFSMLRSISKQTYKLKTKRVGCLVVLGNFDTAPNHIVKGMRQISKNPIQKYMNISAASFEKEIISLFKDNLDGAVVINKNGQLLGAGIYLIVDNPSLDIPEGSGTRHISAASFSTKENIHAVFTLSEETSAVRSWKNGVFVEQYSPNEDLGKSKNEEK